MVERYSIIASLTQCEYRTKSHHDFKVWDSCDRKFLPYEFSIPYGDEIWIEKKMPRRIQLLVGELNYEWCKYNEALHDYLTPQLELEFV